MRNGKRTYTEKSTFRLSGSGFDDSAMAVAVAVAILDAAFFRRVSLLNTNHFYVFVFFHVQECWGRQLEPINVVKRSIEKMFDAK